VGFDGTVVGGHGGNGMRETSELDGLGKGSET
jgi:hypothetical protein